MLLPPRKRPSRRMSCVVGWHAPPGSKCTRVIFCKVLLQTAKECGAPEVERSSAVVAGVMGGGVFFETEVAGCRCFLTFDAIQTARTPKATDRESLSLCRGRLSWWYLLPTTLPRHPTTLTCFAKIVLDYVFNRKFLLHNFASDAGSLHDSIPLKNHTSSCVPEWASTEFKAWQGHHQATDPLQYSRNGHPKVEDPNKDTQRRTLEEGEPKKDAQSRKPKV